jgi:hypothetical protein
MQHFFRNLPLVLISLFSCFHGLSAFASEGRIQLDANAEYETEDLGRGFTLKVFLSKYQFSPDMGIIAGNCRGAASFIAQREATARKIKGKLEISSQIQTGRNILLGTSSCVANATFEADIVKSASQQASSNLIFEAAMKKAVVSSTTAAMVFLP